MKKRILSLVLTIVILSSVAPHSMFNITVDAETENGFTYTVSNGKAKITDYTGSATKLTVPNTLGGYPVIAIGFEAFKDCRKLNSITLPYGVTHIYGQAFKYCYALKTVELPNSVTWIDSYVFAYCNSIERIEIPNNVYLEEGVFYKCTSLTRVLIGSGVYCSNFGVFSDCTALESITIPNDITVLGSSMFRNCTALKSITIPYSVTSICRSAFYNCISLKYVFYIGTPSDKANINVSPYNESLVNSYWHYNATNHNFTNYVSDNNANCIKDSTKTAVCNDGCGATDTVDDVGTKIEHCYTWVIDTPETCGVAGVKHEECTTEGCTAKRSEGTAIAATGLHNLGWVVDIHATCGANGSSHRQCTACTYTDSWGTAIAATGSHVSDNGKVTKKATTKAEGKKVYRCKGCTIVLKTEKLPKLPKTATLKSVKSPKKKQAKITWKKDSKVSGYQIVYATNSKFTKGKKTLTVKGYKATSKTIKSLKSKKTYYVKIRSYKTVKSKKIYGAYSKVKKVKIK